MLVSFSKACAIWICPADATKWPVWDTGNGLPRSSVFKECSMLFRVKCSHVEPRGKWRSSWTALWGHFATQLPFHDLSVPTSFPGPFCFLFSRNLGIYLFPFATYFLQWHLYLGSSGGRTQREKQQQGFAPPSWGHSSSFQGRAFLSLGLLGASGLGCKRMEKRRKWGFASVLSEC